MNTKTVDKRGKPFRVPYPFVFSKSSAFYNRAVLWNTEPSEKQKKILARRIVTIALGISVLVLYFLLFQYEDEIVRLAELTRQGEKINFIFPILIALVFSFVHGAFTESFWNMLGLKPKGQELKPKRQKE